MSSVPGTTAQSARRSPRLPAAERREQILDATLALAAHTGFHAVSIDAVARAAGITRPIVYTHFTDLEGLLNALFDREHDRAMGQLARVIPAAEDPRPIPEVAIDALRTYLEVVVEAPMTWTLVLVPIEGTPPALQERMATDRERVREQLAAVLAAGLEREGLDATLVDLELAAHVIQGISEHAARLVLTEPDAYPVERLMALAGQAIAVAVMAGRAP